MNIKEAKTQIENAIKAYFAKDEYGNHQIPIERQRPVFLMGPPGIGKTAIMEQIASDLGVALVSYSMTHHTRQSALGLPFIEKKVYDGQEYSVSEYTMSEIIASVYDMIEKTGLKEGILFLDEIDGLVQNRQRANNSWEVTQVNEILHQMENFKGIMVGATNFANNLDSAILRRFTYKLEFDFLSSKGKIIFFEKFFQSPLSKEEILKLNSIPNLTPGDFRTVRQSLFYLDEEVPNSTRLKLLEQESATKKTFISQQNNRIGFAI